MIKSTDMITLVIPCVLIYVVIRMFLFWKYPISYTRDLLKVTFVAYLSTLILIVWVKGSSIHTTRLLYNFVPFRTIANYADFSSTRIAMNNLLGNFLLTAPLGFYSVFGIRLLPRSVNIVIYAILLPIIIEGVQLLLFTAGIGMRSVDIDDVILNALGCMLGYSLTKIIRGMLTSAVPLQKEKGEL